MIKNKESLSMIEVVQYLEENKELEKFVKNFTKLKPKEVAELRKKLEDLNMMKMKKEHIVKVIDILPQDKEDLNKIFIGVSPNEDETNKILDTIKEFS
ncbi:hypothetical protein J4407_02150 [Candidatus Pacearchaeota archaeon]|nr:hypothetical protein [Candidatus Pacearchaeota archaeon]